MRFIFVSIGAAVLFTLLGCGNTLELTSSWTTEELKIDGSPTQWGDAPAHIAGPDVYVGVKNDKDNLYVCVTTSNRTTQWQMLALGMTIWFDGEGKRNKAFGIRFPLPILWQGRRLPPDISQINPDDMKRLTNVAERQFETVGLTPADRRRVTTDQAGGILLHLGFAEGNLTLSMKLPLRKSADQPNGIGGDVAKPLAIGLETGEYADPGRTQQSAAPAGGSRGSGGRGGGRGGGAGGRSSGPDTPAGLNHWLMVHLAGSTGSN